MKAETRGMGRGRGISGRIAALGAIAVLLALYAPDAQAAAPQIVTTTVSGVTSASATLEAEIDPKGKLTRYHFEYGPADCASSACASVPSPEGQIAEGFPPTTVKLSLTGLPAGTLYHFRVLAKSSEGKATGTDHIFATYAPPIVGLPDNRGYEQASPVNKDGGDAQGRVVLAKAADDGEGVVFGSAFGLPGGVGAQALPTYIGQREGEAGWFTQGLLPSAVFGERARVLGWLPDLSETYSNATTLTTPRKKAFVAQSTSGERAPTVIAPYTEAAEYSYVGAGADGSVVLFESFAKLPPKEGDPPIAEAIQGAPNLYAWNKASGELHLVSVLNGHVALPNGGIAGPYDWALGSRGINLRLGGGNRSYFLQDNHAFAPDGDVYFTAARSGQLYLRDNPTAEQSNVSGEGKCTEPAKACTIHVSASRKENGVSPDGTDPGGPQPAAFQAASEDGKEVFFTSSEKLTNDANTGPEQPLAAISRDTPDGSPGNLKADFIHAHAVGLVEDSEYIYWADPADGTIGRAKLSGEETSVEPAFITPGPVKCKETEPGVFEEEESSPRYVAVNSEYIYWTNTGCNDDEGEPAAGGGTIGRALLNGDEVKPECIPGKVETSPGVFTNQVSDPQGIAANAAHVYWGNALPPEKAIARATIDCGNVQPLFYPTKNGRIPRGIGLSATMVYFGEDGEGSNLGFVARIPLDGGTEEKNEVAISGMRGLALDAEHIYWTNKNEAAIGRCNLEMQECASKFIEVSGEPGGVAVDAAHLHWSVNGEAPGNPGTDLYRFEPEGGELNDLSVLGGGNGAEVQGLVGGSPDGSYLYFVANGDLDGVGPAEAGDCQTQKPHGSIGEVSGACNLYVWHETASHTREISLVARLRAEGGPAESDVVNWAPTPTGIFGSGAYFPRTARVSEDGQTLLFRSRAKLTGFENHGVAELYLYRTAGGGSLRCVSCNPTGETPEEAPVLGRITFPGLVPSTAIEGVLSRNLSADGTRVFFETPEALSPNDTNGEGEGSCPTWGPNEASLPLLRTCEDVYEWEAPGTGSCAKGSPSYSPIDEGCLYLLSGGKSAYPSLFADASESGNDAFFFTREGLVGQDEDELQDVYDTRVGGGLASQNPVHPPPCEGVEACHGPGQTSPAETTPSTPSFQGPADPKPKRGKAKHHAKHHKKKGKRHGRRRAVAERRVGR